MSLGLGCLFLQPVYNVGSVGLQIRFRLHGFSLHPLAGRAV